MGTSNNQGHRPARNRVISAFLSLVLWITRKRSSFHNRPGGKHILLTATFYSENWILSQLMPLSLASDEHSIVFVSATPVPDIDGVEVIYPPAWVVKVLGAVPSRLLVFAWQGIRRRPDVIGGFHLLINGLVALLVAKLVHRQSLYICVGGPTEVVGGGFATENRIFGKLTAPDEKIEHQLLNAVARFDRIVVRGKSAREFLRARQVATPINTITAGIDSDVFTPAQTDKRYDLVFLARLSDVKRIDVFLEIVSRIQKQHIPDVRALVIGDGPNRELADHLVSNAGIADNVTMLGQRDDVAGLLNQSKVFVLTSRSEGLSQAMVQAMLCGLPAVVSNVGSLADLVNENCGALVDENENPDAYVLPIVDFLTDNDRRERAGQLAREAALQCSVLSVAKKWNDLLGDHKSRDSKVLV